MKSHHLHLHFLKEYELQMSYLRNMSCVEDPDAVLEGWWVRLPKKKRQPHDLVYKPRDSSPFVSASEQDGRVLPATQLPRRVCVYGMQKMTLLRAEARTYQFINPFWIQFLGGVEDECFNWELLFAGDQELSDWLQYRHHLLEEQLKVHVPITQDRWWVISMRSAFSWRCLCCTFWSGSCVNPSMLRPFSSLVQDVVPLWTWQRCWPWRFGNGFQRYFLCLVPSTTLSSCFFSTPVFKQDRFPRAKQNTWWYMMGNTPPTVHPIS